MVSGGNILHVMLVVLCEDLNQFTPCFDGGVVELHEPIICGAFETLMKKIQEDSLILGINPKLGGIMFQMYFGVAIPFKSNKLRNLELGR